MGGLAGLINLNGDPVDDRMFQAFVRDHGIPEVHPVIRYASVDRSFQLTALVSDRIHPPVKAERRENANTRAFFYGELYEGTSSPERQLAMLADRYEQENGIFLSELNGTFTLIFSQYQDRRITLVNDRTAALPLYYAQIGNLFAFGPRLYAISHLPGFLTQLNPTAVSNYLTCGYILEYNTLLDAVKRLGPGELLTIERGKIKRHRYWQFAFAVQRRRETRRELVQQLGDLIQQAVKRRIGDTCFGVPLSGGYDSRAIIGSVKSLVREEKIPTITWGVEETRPDSDALIARAISEKLQTEHRFFRLNAEGLSAHFRTFVILDEGRTDGVGNYPEGLRIFENIRTQLKVDVLLRGDETFGWKEDIANLSELLHALDIHELNSLPFNYTYLHRKIRRRLQDAGHEQIRRLLRECPYDDLHDIKDHFYFNQRLVGYLHPLNQLKTRVLWIRNPFLDNSILDFIVHVPTEMRLGKNLFISAVKDIFPELDAFPIARNHNLINWNTHLNDHQMLQDFIQETLLSGKSSLGNVADLKALKNLLERRFRSTANVNSDATHLHMKLGRKLSSKINRRLGNFRLEFYVELFRLVLLQLFLDEYTSGHFELD